MFRLIVKGVPTASGQQMLNTTIHPSFHPMDLPLIQRQPDAEGLDYFEVPSRSRRLAMTEFVYMRPPWGEGEIRKVEAKPEVLTPLMVAGFSQCEPPANEEEVTTDVHD